MFLCLQGLTQPQNQETDDINMRININDSKQNKKARKDSYVIFTL